jgi:hypothetical protein
VAEIANVAVIIAGFNAVTALTVTPVPETATVVPAVVKLLPVSVTGTAVPRTPVFGVAKLNVAPTMPVCAFASLTVPWIIVPPGSSVAFAAMGPCTECSDGASRPVAVISA